MTPQAGTYEWYRAEVERLEAERRQAQDKLWEQSEAAANLVKEVERLEAERRQAIDALRQAQDQCREHIRRAAFAPQIGARYTEKLRLAVADECRRLEDGRSRDHPET